MVIIDRLRNTIEGNEASEASREYDRGNVGHRPDLSRGLCDRGQREKMNICVPYIPLDPSSMTRLVVSGRWAVRAEEAPKRAA